MLDSIQSSYFGVLILGAMGSFIAIILIKLSAGYVNKVSPDYSHEVHVFRLLFNESDKKRDKTDHIYLLILSCAFMLGPSSLYGIASLSTQLGVLQKYSDCYGGLM
jgi:hypothetical protein